MITPLRRRPESLARFGASSVAPDDALKSLWATAGAFRFITLAYALYVYTIAASHYTHAHIAGMLMALQCIWTGAVAYGLYARPCWRPGLVVADHGVAALLMYSTWWVAPQSWWDHNQSLPTTMWVINVVLCAGLLWGVAGGFGSGIVLALVSLQVGGDLSWLERSPTIPVFVSAGLGAGVGGSVVRRSHAQLQAALEMRGRAAERERLAREVHDGVLQVLALMGRKGAELGGEAALLGAAAIEQERALRELIASGEDAEHPQGEAGNLVDSQSDLRRALLGFAADGVRVSAGSDAVLIEASRASEIVAAVRQALVNTTLHAGEGVEAFILLEDLGNEVIITVRDDGVGMASDRLAEAREAGRMGVSRSIIGRIEALGGRARLESAPGEGVEWEFTVPR